MRRSHPIRRTLNDLLTAVQFLTRIPVAGVTYEADSLARTTRFFPLVGVLVGGLAVLAHALAAPHLPLPIAALATLIVLVLTTGAFHEDGLADSADGFGGGHTREQTLAIFRDSRLGTYGVTALVLSLAARLLLLLYLPPLHFAATLIAAHVLARWTTLPLSYLLPPARSDSLIAAVDIKGPGQGARVAGLTSRTSLLIGTAIMLALVLPLLRLHALLPLFVTLLVTISTGLYYRHRIQGVTGDNFGATNQLTEIAVYLCGVWV